MDLYSAFRSKDTEALVIVMLFMFLYPYLWVTFRKLKMPFVHSETLTVLKRINLMQAFVCKDDECK